MLRGVQYGSNVVVDKKDFARRAEMVRETEETQVRISLDLDSGGAIEVDTGIPFLTHMLEQFARHSCFSLQLAAKGDVEVDDHHTVEDVGIVLGECMAKALGDKKGISRFGHAYVPLDESLSRAVVDFSGRPGLWYRVSFSRPMIGTFDVDLIREFFQGFANHARATLHLDCLYGRNCHHMAETIFKSFARACRIASAHDALMEEWIPSTKGLL